MKLLSLRLKNINSFKNDIHLDFTKEPLSDASLFAITGPTGSGKTTLLDAISVAMYNKTPRLGGTGSSNPSNLLSQGTDEGFSEVVFQADGSQYLAQWRARRSKKGDIKSEVKLLRNDTGELITSRRKGKGGSDLADMSVEDAVASILGMDFSAFKRSILLAQGDFAAFLKASGDERRQILEATTGMGLFEVLKENLNQQVRKVTTEYEIAGAGLEAIPQVSAEEIEEEAEKLACLESELQGLNESRTALEKEKESEQRRVDTHKKLDGARKRQQELLLMKDDIDRLGAEIEQAQKAADIRSEMDSYHAEKERVKTLETALEKSMHEREIRQRQLDEAKAKYDASSLDFENFRKEAHEKENTYNVAAVLETSGSKQLDDAKKIYKEADDLKVILDGLESRIQLKKKEITGIEEWIKADMEFLEHNPLPENADDLLTRASRIAANMAEKEHTKVQKQDAVSKEKEELREKTDELEVAAGEMKDIEGHKKDISARLDTSNQALQLLLEEGDEQYWRTVMSAWGEVRDAGSRFCQDFRQLSKIFDETIQTTAVQEFKDTLNSFRHRAELLKQQILTSEEKVKRCLAEEKALLAANQALILRREHLAEGEPCPVCGSTEHPFKDEHEPDIEEAIERAKENVQTAGTELEAEKHDLESMHSELSRTAKEKVTAFEGKLIEIENLSRQIDSTESELKLVEQKTESVKARIGSLNRHIESTGRKMQDISAGITEIEEDIAGSSEQFFSIIPSDFKGEPIDSALEKFKKYISEIRDCITRLGQNRSIFGELRTFIEENGRRLAEDTARCTTLLETAAGYEKEGSRLLGQVMEMTGGMGVEGARSALGANLAEKEKQLIAVQEELRKAERQLAEVTAQSGEQQAELERTQEKMAAAQSVYLRALDAAGFGSHDVHKSFFREAAWLEGKRDELQKYASEVHAVDDNVRAYEGVFAQTPFNPGDLRTILDTEHELIAAIEEKNSLKGEVNKTIRYQKENLEKRQEQEKQLEGTMQEMERWQKLAGVIPANSLRDFALQTMFDLLLAIANRQLSDITSRYALKAVGMKDMVVLDLWNAGEERPVETLSGGESFLVSLSLALALSELSSGRSRLESLFLDEGFGTLDSETLDAVLNALESLRLSGRTIGVISHVDQLTRRIPVRVEVKKTGSGTSKVQVRG